MDDWTTATAVLRASAQLVEGIQDGLGRRGFDDVRPAHGFAFAILAERPLTATELAAELGVTKQAAAQLAEHLVGRGYLERRVDPHDRRTQRLVLTRSGHACTHAAQEASSETVATWREQVPASAFAGFVRTLGGVQRPGRLRPSW